MAINSDKPFRWKADIAQSIDFYNNWFLAFAPETYRSTRAKTSEQVKSVAFSLSRIEEERITVQIALDAKKTLAERNKLGQFATPPRVANEILDLLHKYMP